MEEVRKAATSDFVYSQARNWTEQEAVSEDRKDKEGILEVHDGLLYRKGMLWVAEGLINQILRSEHDTKVAGHMGQDKTIELIRRNFWWPKINE